MAEGVPSVPVLPGEVLAGKYRIERVIGQGAMGAVVAARHLQLDQRVAIKFLRAEVAHDRTLAERFRQEARAAAKLRGEHVARVFDVDELEGGVPFFVMELVEGMNLADFIAAEGPLPPATAVELVLQACDALAQAHAAGIVHRDLKPGNLFVSSKPSGGLLLKVLDFGISKVSGGQAATTQATALLGSPLYMSPEQLVSARDVDGRTDIWSLGVVLYELVTGALPFVGDTVPQVCVQIREAPAPSLRALRAEVPAGLEAVVLRCLQKDPARRFATIQELVAALGSCLAGLDPGRAPEPSPGERTRRARRGWATAVALLTALAAMVALVLHRDGRHASEAPPGPSPAAAAAAPNPVVAPQRAAHAPAPSVPVDRPVSTPSPLPELAARRPDRPSPRRRHAVVMARSGGRADDAPAVPPLPSDRK